MAEAKVSTVIFDMPYQNRLVKHIIRGSDTARIFESKISHGELYYQALVPEGKIKGALVLLPGAWEETESVLTHNKQLCQRAYDKGVMTVVPSANAHICLDTPVLDFLNKTFADVIVRYGVADDAFVIGGFSLGGTVSLRYTEMAYEDVRQTAIVPCAAFCVDGPVDYITLYRQFETGIRRNMDGEAIAEAAYFIDRMHNVFGGSPGDTCINYVKHSVYNRGEAEGGNARYLATVPVRVYADPDIDWAMKYRKKDYYDMNAPGLSALIVELNLQGNDKAAFINRLGKGFRLDGTRHPHSWSLLDADDCMEWLLMCLE
jgi:pimeloyl-ACP methyl ester carboxylesterase